MMVGSDVHKEEELRSSQNRCTTRLSASRKEHRSTTSLKGDLYKGRELCCRARPSASGMRVLVAMASTERTSSGHDGLHGDRRRDRVEVKRGDGAVARVRGRCDCR
jgi:hypothetical protein